MLNRKNELYDPNIKKRGAEESDAFKDYVPFNFGAIHNVGNEPLWRGPKGDYIRSCVPVPGYKPIGNKTEIELKKE